LPLLSGESGNNGCAFLDVCVLCHAFFLCIAVMEYVNGFRDGNLGCDLDTFVYYKHEHATEDLLSFILIEPLRD
jgi:hypothetical protein